MALLNSGFFVAKLRCCGRANWATSVRMLQPPDFCFRHSLTEWEAGGTVAFFERSECL